MLALTVSALAPLCHLRHGPRPDRRRALELLASCRDDGCTEAIMVAHGFTIDFLADMVRAGIAAAKVERVAASGRRILPMSQAIRGRDDEP